MGAFAYFFIGRTVWFCEARTLGIGGQQSLCVWKATGRLPAVTVGQTCLSHMSQDGSRVCRDADFFGDFVKRPFTAASSRSTSLQFFCAGFTRGASRAVGACVWGGEIQRAQPSALCVRAKQCDSEGGTAWVPLATYSVIQSRCSERLGPIVSSRRGAPGL